MAELGHICQQSTDQYVRERGKCPEYEELYKVERLEQLSISHTTRVLEAIY